MIPMAKRAERKKPRRARRYDIFLPLKFNDQRPIPRRLFSAVEKRLLARFGGLTSQHQHLPLKGIWEERGKVFLDEIVVFTAIDFQQGGSPEFVFDLKDFLLRKFDQPEIMITEISLGVF